MTRGADAGATAANEGGDRAEAVTRALRDAGELHEADRIVDVSRLSGGWSRMSYVATPSNDASRAYIVRAEAPGGVLETDLEPEYELYRALQDEPAIATPRVFHFEPSGDNPFGNRYIVMERIGGTAPNAFRGRDRRALEEDWAGARGIAAGMVETLARLHTFPAEKIPGGAVQRLGFLDVVERWQAVYEEKHLVRDPVTEEAFAWLREREPAEEQTGVVHGDYRVGNVLVDGGRIAAVLDWELAYIGDVRFDLGYLALERLAGKHLQPVTELMNAFADEAWFLREYEQRVGRPVDREVVRTFSVLGIMMLLATHYLGFWMYVNGRSEDFRLVWNRFGLVGLRQDLTNLMEW